MCVQDEDIDIFKDFNKSNSSFYFSTEKLCECAIRNSVSLFFMSQQILTDMLAQWPGSFPPKSSPLFQSMTAA